ncbi:MAG: ABC-F family ATP-binding cassette domain-containing protein [candidate division KSB1 bacterium]|nr:ABC-F family ATP-binding cassette domain-containing protein [candidate division KSB1 bacterium]
MIHIKDISHSIGERTLFRSLSWTLPAGKRFALIGPNGCGKTTLLRVLCGELTPEAGTITKSNEYKIGYLPQDNMVSGDKTLIEFVRVGRPDLVDLEEQIHDKRLTVESDPENSKAVEQLGGLEHQYENLGGYTLDSRAKSILAGLGFETDSHGYPLSQFSGGWRMRAYLARLLLYEPDLLLLDEPTNHLDLPSLEWLEAFLASFKGTIVLVSHDRFFIDKLATDICELVKGKLRHYSGNYHDYEKQKEQQIEQLIAAQEQQKKQIQKQEQFIERFRYKATKASQVQSRIKQLEKLKELEDVSDIQQSQSISFRIQVHQQSYKHVLHMQNVHFKYDADWVLKHVNLDLYRGDKVALVGANGAGKTTLTRCIVNELQPQTGDCRLGKRVQPGYFAQHHTEALDLDSTIIDQVNASVADEHIPRVRDVLGLFGFSGDDVDKPVKVLSGGEKARVSLAKILLSPVNFLIMDEPTNHLDMKSKEALEHALSEYEGTLLLISHDRYFLDKIVTRVLEMQGGVLRSYEGNYSDYMDRRQQEQEIKTAAPNRAREERRRRAQLLQSISKDRGRLQNAIQDCEQEIEQLEARKAEIEQQFSDTGLFQDGGRVAELQKEYDAVREQIEERMLTWESSQEELEQLLDQIR